MKKMIYRGLICIVIAGVGLPSIAATNKPRLAAVLIITDEQAQMSDPLEQAIQSQISDLDGGVLVEQIPHLPTTLKSQVERAKAIAQKSSAICVFWFNVEEGNQVLLYLIQYEGDSILVRHINEESEEARIEAMAVIVRMSMAELLRGGQIGIEVKQLLGQDGAKTDVKAPEPKTKEQKPKPHPEEDQQLKPQPRGFSILNIGLAYAYYAHSAKHPVNHGLDLRIGFGVHPNWMVFVAYTLISPIEGSQEGTTIHLRRHPLRLGVHWALPVTPRIDIGTSVAILMDYATLEVFTHLTSSDDKSDFLASGFAALELEVALADKASIGFAAGAELTINPVYYGYTDSSGRHVLIDAWPLQPWVFVGFAFDLF